MRIITVNVPESYLKIMDGLIGENGIYPSRSELIRVSLREFLIQELNSMKAFKLPDHKPENKPIIQGNIKKTIDESESDLVYASTKMEKWVQEESGNYKKMVIDVNDPNFVRVDKGLIYRIIKK